MTAALVALAGVAGVLTRYGIGRATLHTEAVLTVLGGLACAVAGYALGRAAA